MKNIDYEALRMRVDKRMVSRIHITSRVFFITNLFLYALSTLVSVTVIRDSPNIRFDGARGAIDLALTFAWFGWGLCILFYWISMVMNNPRRIYRMHRQVTEQELGRMAIEAMGSEARLEKPKRHAPHEMELYEMEFSDDGELVATDELFNTSQTRCNSHDTF